MTRLFEQNLKRYESSQFKKNLSLAVSFFALLLGNGGSVFGFDYDLFGEVSVNSHEDGVLYDNKIMFIKASYIPDMQENRPYCSLSFVSIHNVGCDVDPDISGGLLVSDGLSYDNYDDKLPVLNCDVKSVGGADYKLTATVKDPKREEKHEFIFSRISGDFFRLKDYSGYNIYYSDSSGRYATEFYAPIRTRGESYSLRLYKQLPTNCSTLTVPALPE